MLTLLLMLSQAFAGEIVFDARVPTRVLVGDQIAGIVYEPGELRFDRAPGTYPIVAFVDGQPYKTVVVVQGDQASRVLISKTGVSVANAPAATTQAADPAATSSEAVPSKLALNIHTDGTSKLMVVLDGRRHLVGPGLDAAAELAAGDHALGVRSADGTQVYADGILRVSAGGQAILLVAEGRMPEASGDAVSWFVGGD